MYRCSEVVRLISSDEYLTAGVLKKFGIRWHLATCENCKRYVLHLRALAATFRKATEIFPLPDLEETKAYILQRLSHES